MLEVYEQAKRELGYNATRFKQMVAELGGVATARRLVRASTPSEGFSTLWEHRRLDLTVESHMLRPEFSELFTEEERDLALRRLEAFGWHRDPQL